MGIILDPSVRVLDDNHQIFVLHPGQGKRFYSDFIANKAVFLDLPGIKFNEVPNIDSEHVRSSLRMSRAISGWYRKGKPNDKKPSRNPADYIAKTENLPASRFMTEVKELYTTAKTGDLVIIPGQGYNTQVYIGEFTGPLDIDYTITSERYPFETIPARKVKFLKTNLAKWQFGARLVRLMQNRQAIIKITQDDDVRDVYEKAYGNYVWGDTSGSMLRVTKNVIDLHELNQTFALTNYFGAQYAALKCGELEEFLRLPFYDAIDKYYNRELFGDVSIEIHSPGFFGRPMRNQALAGYVTAMLALSGANVSAEDAAELTVQNSANPNQTICDETLEEDVRATMEMYMNNHLWEEEVCARRAVIEDAVGLDTNTKVTNDD